MSSIHQHQQIYHQPYDVIDPVYYTDQHQLQQQYLYHQQQIELERIRQVQQQAAYQQQRAFQQMLYYEQELQQQQQQQQLGHQQFDGTDSFDFMNTATIANYSQDSSSPPGMMGGKAQRRAEHNAIERARRESLNTKFQQLAHSLPNLQNDRRPSKGTIIERTLEYVKQTVQKEERFQNEIEQLRQANESLISKMTTDNVIEEMDEEDEDEDEEETSTPECEDNFSSRSSVTSISSQHHYYHHQDLQHDVFNKFQQDSSSSILLNKESYIHF